MKQLESANIFRDVRFPWHIKKITTPGQFVTWTHVVTENDTAVVRLLANEEVVGKLLLALPKLLKACQDVAKLEASIRPLIIHEEPRLEELFEDCRQAYIAATGEEPYAS